METLLVGVMGTPLWAWLGFLVLVLLLLAFDLGVLHRRCHEIGLRESLLLSAFYVGLGVAFGGLVGLQFGADAAVDYWTGFVVEKSLALDNIFVIATIFGYFAIPRAYQHRVLIFGVLGVIVLRGLMIGAGAALLQQFHWLLYLFAGFLVVTGVRLLVTADQGYDVAANPLLRLLQRRCRVAPCLHGDRFFLRLPDPATGRLLRYATPLFLALVLVEIADVIFAVDSVPAIFAITTDPFVVYSSNIFAILGLRALFFALAAVIHRFADLKYALAVVLLFIGGKILAADWLGLAEISPLWSLSVTLAILVSGLLVSLWRTARPQAAAAPASAGGTPADRQAAD
ncbi:tellurite resistance protein TerC [Tistlia consotensis]|uniref:Tellurite resistance protein TerC n=1 Tax=Tistlia consotensis USBA 355 TaxID=560819 RepID=A0A1Y6BYE7_9PROT|nr:TerC/Alx family metal homeostasis membrane protein [Tistlia consotensis]SMF36108.1 tellurite resistance protein TerC [Tistlia consotensis USBA 355]SNR71439.1 tellurite resistance protein TerC [Tistlia consotensis]